jgi:hypothetical protein
MNTNVAATQSSAQSESMVNCMKVRKQIAAQKPPGCEISVRVAPALSAEWR